MQYWVLMVKTTTTNNNKNNKITSYLLDYDITIFGLDCLPQILAHERQY